MKNSMFAIPFSIVTFVVGALKSTTSHVAWSFRCLQFSQIFLITFPLPVPFSSRENFKDPSGVGQSLCTDGVFGIFKDLTRESGPKTTLSLILVSMRADRTPFVLIEGLTTSIRSNLPRNWLDVRWSSCLHMAVRTQGAAPPHSLNREPWCCWAV